MKRYKSFLLLALCVLLGAFLIPHAMDAVGSSSPLLFAALCLAAGCFLHEVQKTMSS